MIHGFFKTSNYYRFRYNPGLAALAAASAYVLIIATVVLIGMDYADSGRLLQRVRGVGEIASSLLAA